jgi:hypothetical protein
MVFGKNKDRKRKGHAFEQMNVVRKAVIAALKPQEPEKKTGYTRIMSNALMKDDYRNSPFSGVT